MTAPTGPRIRVVRDRGGLRLLEGDAVLSRVMARPGPTHMPFDVLAACVAALSPGRRALLLGFAGGGTVAALRAMGWRHRIDAVDLSLEGHAHFREHSGPWSGPVRVVRAEAGEFLRRTRTRWDTILEDLSVIDGRSVTKPVVSVGALPGLMRRRLAPRGICAVDALRVPGMTWDALLARLAAPFATAFVVTFEEYENRILIAGAPPILSSARSLASRLRAALRAIGSRQAARIAVRRLRRGAVRKPDRGPGSKGISARGHFR